MTSSETNIISKPAPATVGNTFVKQYYQLLTSEPEKLHRFFKEDSSCSQGNGSQVAEPVSGQKNIHEQTISRNYAVEKVELDQGSIDCQDSICNGVVVMVTGVMTFKGSLARKPFVQTFFLAAQPSGYFVQNDILRFLEFSEIVSNSSTSTTVAKASAVVSPTKTKTPVAQAAIGTSVASLAAASAPAVPNPTKSSPAKAALPQAVSPKKADALPASLPVPNPSSPVKYASPERAEKSVSVKLAAASLQSPVKKAEPAEPAPPKSWLTHLFAPSAEASSCTTSKPAVAVKQAPKQAPVSVPVSTSTAPVSSENESDQKQKYHSLYVRNVHSETKDQDLRALFQPFGPIANINIISGRGHAFVDYYDESSVRAALAPLSEGKQYKVNDKVIHVGERGERKENLRTTFRGDGRGGRGKGQGGFAKHTDRKDMDRKPPSSAPRLERRDKNTRKLDKSEGYSNVVARSPHNE